MTATIHTLPTRATHHTPPDTLRSDTLRSDCERLMRRLVREGRTPTEDMRALADFLDYLIEQSEGRK